MKTEIIRVGGRHAVKIVQADQSFIIWTSKDQGEVEMIMAAADVAIEKARVENVSKMIEQLKELKETLISKVVDNDEILCGRDAWLLDLVTKVLLKQEKVHLNEFIHQLNTIIKQA